MEEYIVISVKALEERIKDCTKIDKETPNDISKSAILIYKDMFKHEKPLQPIIEDAIRCGQNKEWMHLEAYNEHKEKYLNNFKI